jgi:hypothetical protein
MTIRKRYNIGETVWIYGIYVRNDVPVQGQVIHRFNLKFEGFDPTVEHYVIAVDSHIEPLIEVRTWETISQDEQGPVGGLRGLNDTADRKVLAKTGFDLSGAYTYSDSDEESDDPTPEEIHAAMERSQQTAVLPPLVLKEHKTNKPRRYNKKPRKP